MDDLYTEIILDHFKNPHNQGKLENPTARVKEHNPLCGDVIQLDLLLNKKGKVECVAFTGTGCAISQASASILSDELIGKTPDEIKSISNEDLLNLLGIEISAARLKCALLALITAKKAAILAKHAKK